jgi:L-rhamnose-H+ transport protein
VSTLVLFGLLLTLVAGVLSGNCMLPMKFVRRWAWENAWLVFSLISLVILPWILAFTLVPNVLNVYASLRPDQFVVPLLFGFGWGIAQVLFGLSITRLGLALGYAVIIGLGASLGTLVPLFFSHAELVATSKGALVLSGVAIMILGIVVSAFAGKQREAAEQPSTAKTVGSYGSAVLMAVICGIMAPMLNFAFAFGQHIADKAIAMGSTPASAAYAVWPVGLFGGLIPNLGYSIYLLNKNRTWDRFRVMMPDIGFASLMGVFWVGAIALYGVSSVYLGALGTSAGWALFQIFMIITANISGVVTGEWKKAPLAALRQLWAGLGLLAIATGVIAMGNR